MFGMLELTNGIDNLISLQHFAEHDVLAIQPAGDSSGNELIGKLELEHSM